MSSKDDWFDPRLTVFVIWGIFVILFICIPSKRIVQRIFALMGCSCCGYDEEPPPAHAGVHEVSYEILSSARKQELDSLRASHLTFRVHPFSLTLERKHMLRRVSSESPKASQNDTATLPQDRKPDPHSSHNHDDIETGLARGIDPPERDKEEKGEGDKEGVENKEGNADKGEGEENKEEEEDIQFTHISIPLPGHNFDGMDMHNKPEASKEDEKKRPEKEEKKSGSKIRIFGGKGKEGSKDLAGNQDDAKTLEPDRGEKETERRRTCPVFCAVCLMEYEPAERVSWSSNPDCTHVFHEDCIVNWLVSLGKTKSKMQRFPEDPSEAQLLNYSLECPCCRQEFISRGVAELPEVRGAEERA